MKRKTIKNTVEISGIGLHKGEKIKMVLRPVSQETGIIFKRLDVNDKNNVIKVAHENLFDLERGTNIQNEDGVRLHTIEHFMSALSVCGITDIFVEIEGNEMPILDGSSIQFVEKIENVEIILDERGFIPETYIEKDERLNIYKRFAMLETDSELNNLLDEIRDRFGKIPEQMKKFILSIKLKLFAEKHKIQRILETRNHFELYFLENAQEEQAELSEKIEMKKVVKIINSTVSTGKNKKEDIADNFVIMKVKKNEFIKNL